MIKVTFNNGKSESFPKNTPIKAIATYYEPYMENPILGAEIDNEIVAMNELVNHDCIIKFLDVLDINGYKMYQAGLKFIFEVALKDTFGKHTCVYYEHSVGKGLIANVSNGTIKESDTTKIKECMAKIIGDDLVFERHLIYKKDAINYFNKIGYHEKALNIQNINNDIISLYKLKNNINYFYSKMPYSTKAISKFNIKYLGNNKYVLLYPSSRTKGSVPEYVHYDNVIKTFQIDKNWLRLLNVPYASDINNMVACNNINTFIRTSELDFNNKIFNIVNDIMDRDDVKFIMIAGPSSSGKTTTTRKLSFNLRSRGLDPVIISVDDYFVDRDKTPLDNDNNPDYESLQAIDLAFFNEQLNKMLNEEEVTIPSYNFVTGKREFRRKPVTLKENSIILIEGLHCLNNELVPDIPPEYMYKIYLSPFIPLNIDRHNYISTIDLRFLRRMVRDYQTRGRSVDETIDSWQSVRKGEEKYIFPYIHQADCILNTALPYEIGVLKVFCEPLLFNVGINSIFFEETRRLLDFLKIFYSISAEAVPNDSIIREFIGGSVFSEESVK